MMLEAKRASAGILIGEGTISKALGGLVVEELLSKKSIFLLEISWL